MERQLGGYHRKDSATALTLCLVALRLAELDVSLAWSLGTLGCAADRHRTDSASG